MGILTAELPDLPSSVSDKYFITYKQYNDDYYYILTSVNTDYYDGLVESDYKISSDLTSNWVLVDNSWHSTFDKDYSDYRNFYATDIIYSSYDIYSATGEFYYPESNYEFSVSVVGSTLSSSGILHSLNSEFFPAVLVCCCGVVFCIGFRKAWNLLQACIRGA